MCHGLSSFWCLEHVLSLGSFLYRLSPIYISYKWQLETLQANLNGPLLHFCSALLWLSFIIELSFAALKPLWNGLCSNQEKALSCCSLCSLCLAKCREQNRTELGLLDKLINKSKDSSSENSTKEEKMASNILMHVSLVVEIISGIPP